MPKVCLSSILVVLVAAACHRAPDTALLQSIGQDVQRFEAQQRTFLQHLDYLDAAQDSLELRFLSALTPAGQAAFLRDTAALRLYTTLKAEYVNNQALYAAFVREYNASLDELRIWYDALPNGQTDAEAARNQWKKYVEQFEKDIASEAEIMRAVKEWERTFQEKIRDFGIRYNYLEPGAQAQQ
jgi:hypothetical protein